MLEFEQCLAIVVLLIELCGLSLLFHLFVLLVAVILLYIEKSSEKWEFGFKHNTELKCLTQNIRKHKENCQAINRAN